MRNAVVLVCLMALLVANADATTPMNHCTTIASVNGRAMGGIVMAAHMSPERLASLCATITLTTPGEWKNYRGTHLPAGWKIGDVYRNNTGELAEVAAPPRLLPSVNAAFVPVFSSQDGWQQATKPS
jgi:hypothetical protein